jgi:hypothetical protein
MTLTSPSRWRAYQNTVAVLFSGMDGRGDLTFRTDGTKQDGGHTSQHRQQIFFGVDGKGYGWR